MIKYIFVILLLILQGCTYTQQCPEYDKNEVVNNCPECKVCEICDESKYVEVVKNEEYYQNEIQEYYQQRIVGTWRLNEHQSFSFNEDGTGFVTDDGTGRLDGVSGRYSMTYSFLNYQMIMLYFTNGFECDVIAATGYPISFIDNRLVLHQNYLDSTEYKDIVLTKIE